MTAYIIQVVMFHLLFLLVYETLLKKETFFTWNRIYLLVTAIISLLLPLIKIEALSIFAPAESFSAITTEWLPEVIIGNTPQTIEHLPAVEISAKSSEMNWWLTIYSLGFFGSILLVFKKYKNLERLFSFKTISAEKEWRIIEVPNSTIACTFYRTIFLGDRLTEVERQQIFSHELVHVKQKHSLDLVFFEILKIIFWFNPLIYIYQNRIATLHEFIADAAVVKSTEKRNYYEQLLNSAFNTHNISFINQFFNHSLIKKRIVMLQKSKSKSISKVKYLILVPLMMAMLTIVACSEESPEALTNDESISKQLDEIKQALDAGRELTESERNQFYIIMEQVVKDKNFPPPPSPSANNSGIIEVVEQRYQGNADVPFAVIDEVPVFPGCEQLETNNAKKDCMAQMMREHVDHNFNTDLGKELGLTGVNRIIVVFKIDKNGNITDIRSRGPHPSLEEEAKRIIEALPKMTPGRQQGQEVNVSYSLPIVFDVNE